MSLVPMTREGLEKLRAELKRLEENHPELLRAVRVAREKGDLSENAEFHAAREVLVMNENNIAHLRAKIGSAAIVNTARIGGDRVVFGATVKLKNLEDGEEEEFTLVGEGEADPFANRILTTSPMGKALLTHQAGDEVTVPVPKGTLQYKVLEIRFG